MRNYILGLALLGAFFLGLSPASGAEAIDLFDIQVDLQPDSSFVVTETIVYEFGDNYKHGIYRDIPLRHHRDVDTGYGQIKGAYNVRLHVLGVGNERGEGRLFKVIHQGDGVRIRIGSPETTVTGTQIYKIRYVVQRAINYFAEWDEFYWNATGHQWNVPIRKAQVKVVLPGKDPAPLVKAANFVGYLGSTDSVLATEQPGFSYELTAENLSPSQGVTLVLALQKGQLQEPGKRQKLMWFLADNIILLISIGLPLFILLAMGLLYWKRGRDPDSHLPVMVQYEAPKDLNPAEVGTLLDEVAHTSDIVSTVLDLAARGYIKIKEIETKTLLFFTNTDYEFIKVKEADNQLNSFEKKFLRHLLGAKDSKKLSELKNKFYVHLSDLQDELYAALVKKKMFPRKPSSVRTSYAVVTSILIVLLGVLLVVVGIHLNQESHVPFVFVSCALSVGIAILFSRVMPRKSLKGSQAVRHCRGFEEFLSRVEKDRIKRMAEKDPQIFGRLLPYAVVLGCADEWAEKFEGLLTEPPDWYVSHHPYSPGSFRTGLLVRDLGQGMNSMANTFKSQPQSSGGSGSSGFSSGGGFSGGGFGGGGGGSW
ncbi:MAG: DUF2207 domain-containing protein [Bdellovibrionaceae bacterium]|nr:DUF2207 domain-containing protein [Bdellovibrionales bacterium]MCB9084024.1 DUF2207 domain-containing protein [Pseudobdellovibrionaceae bacterium]